MRRVLNKRSVFDPVLTKNTEKQKEKQETKEKLVRKTQDCNTAVAENRMIREKIDGLRKERVVLNKIYHKLENELKHKKDELNTTIQKAEKAYLEREAIRQEIKALQEADEREEAEYQQQIMELNQQIEKDKQVRDYIEKQEELAGASVQKTGKNKDHETTSLNKKDPSSGAPPPNNHNELINNEKMLRKKTIEKANEISKDIMAIITQKTDLHPITQEYEDETLNKIKEATETEKDDKIIEEFQKAGARNQWLNDFVEEVKGEILSLDKEIEEIKYDISKYKGLVESTDNNRERMMNQLKEERKKAQDEGDKYQNKLIEANKTIDALKIGISNIYKSLGCEAQSSQSSQVPTTQILGTHGVTESNMMQYLGVIEQRTNELLEIYEFSKDLKTRDTNPKGFSIVDKDNEKEKNLKNKQYLKVKSCLTELNTVPDDSNKREKGEDKVKAMSMKEFKERGRKKAEELLGNKR